jgi:hypothetical protein
MSFMSEGLLSQIEDSIVRLTVEEQRLLVSRLSNRLRREAAGRQAFESDLAEMAKDEDIKLELKRIEADFHHTEFDGLAE